MKYGGSCPLSWSCFRLRLSSVAMASSRPCRESAEEGPAADSKAETASTERTGVKGSRTAPLYPSLPAKHRRSSPPRAGAMRTLGWEAIEPRVRLRLGHLLTPRSHHLRCVAGVDDALGLLHHHRVV